MNLSDIVHRAADDQSASSLAGYDHSLFVSKGTNETEYTFNHDNEQQRHMDQSQCYPPLDKPSESHEASKHHPIDAQQHTELGILGSPGIKTTNDMAPSAVSLMSLPKRYERIAPRIPPPGTSSPLPHIASGPLPVMLTRLPSFIPASGGPLNTSTQASTHTLSFINQPPRSPDQKIEVTDPVPKEQSDDQKTTSQTLSTTMHNRQTGYGTLTITGSNVTESTLEEGYIQFILHHDPVYAKDSLENLMYVKRKFSSVPRTGDISYTTWDVFVLVKKLYHGEIKNWSQLVGHLGLSDMAGRPQFAQRVKRWMHKYKIDSYFDYLLGNDYRFHCEDDKFSGCLTMGNHQKRRPPRLDETDATRSPEESDRHYKRHTSKSKLTILHPNGHRDDDDDEDGDDESANHSDDEEQGSKPILFPGSRKRLREAALDPQQLEKTRRFEDGEESAEDSNDSSIPLPRRDTRDEDHHNNSLNIKQARERKEPRTKKRRKRSVERNAVDTPDGKEIEEEEQDELDSTSSSAPSPILPFASLTTKEPTTYRQMRPMDAFTPQSLGGRPSLSSDGSGGQLPHLSDTSKALAQGTFDEDAARFQRTSPSPDLPRAPCTECIRLNSTVSTLQKNVTELQATVEALSKRVEDEMQKKNDIMRRLSQAEDTCKRYSDARQRLDAWRKRIAEELLKDPFPTAEKENS